jgi:hypothetical protein
MLSVIVVHREGDKRPGPEFFTLAKNLGEILQIEKNVG